MLYSELQSYFETTPYKVRKYLLSEVTNILKLTFADQVELIKVPRETAQVGVE